MIPHTVSTRQPDSVSSPASRWRLGYRGLFVAILISFLPFFTGYGYLYLNVKKSITEQRISQVLLKQEELRKRNAALKKELSRYSIGGAFRDSPNALELLEHSRIIHLELPPLPETPRSSAPGPKDSVSDTPLADPFAMPGAQDAAR